MYNDIQRIFRWDEKYLKFQKKKSGLKKLFTRMQEFQYDLAEKNLDQGPGYRALKPEDIDKIDDCMTMEELDDHYEHFQAETKNILVYFFFEKNRSENLIFHVFFSLL